MDNTELNCLAVFSDETKYYRDIKNNKADVKIRLLKNDADSVSLVVNNEPFPMLEKHSKNNFDYFIYTFDREFDTDKYYFEIVKNDVKYYYSKVGVSREPLRYADFSVMWDFKIPEWAVGNVMYQIYVDRFYNGDKTNDVKSNEYIYLGKPVIFRDNWNEYPSADDVRSFYGGDLTGVMEKLPYLKELGIETIYFNPVFVSPSNHKYDTQDYEHIDPHIGKVVNCSGHVLEKTDRTNENASLYSCITTNNDNLEASDKLFASLVEKAHKNGIKVILDGVFNHCGAFNKWLNREGIYKDEADGAFRNINSKFRNYFIWNNDSDAENYEAWWGFSNHPKLNYEGSNELFNDIMNVAAKWLKPPFNADGWRIDVGADLGRSPEYNHYFWKEFRKNVKAVNKEAFILAEHYGDASPWLDGKQWDTVMNYDAFMEPVSYFFTGMEKHSDYYNSELYNNGIAFANAMVQAMAKLPYQSLVSAMNELSNHDHSRFLTRTNMTEGRVSFSGSPMASKNTDMRIMKEAVLFQMTWVGSPTVYYGDEAGVYGWTDPDNRRTYPWGNENMEILNFHKQVIKLRKENEIFKTGSTMFLNEDTGVISYARFSEEEIFVVIFNNNNSQCVIDVPVWRCGAVDENVFKIIFDTEYSSVGNILSVDNGVISVSVAEKSGVVIYNGN